MKEKLEKANNMSDKADRDLRAAEVLLKDKDAEFHSGNIYFHCQQCVEKYLKAFLIAKETKAPKTHDLLYLIELCSDYDSTLKSYDLSDFASFDVEIRYDDPLPSLEEANTAINTARKLAKYLKQMLDSLK